MRTRKRASWLRAKSHASSAVRRLPRCSVPVGLGAKRPSEPLTREGVGASVEEVRTGASKDRHAMPRTVTMPPAARGHQTLSAYISSRFDEFSRSQKDVAQYVVDHLDEVAFHT